MKKAEKAERERAEMEAELSVARKDADEARKLAREIELKQRHRILPDDLIASVTEEAAKSEKKDFVEITCVINDPEAWALAVQVRNAFVAAGFRIDKISPTMNTPPIKGLRIIADDFSPSPVNKSTGYLLKYFSLPLQAIPASEESRGKWIIQIGQKS